MNREQQLEAHVVRMRAAIELLLDSPTPEQVTTSRTIAADRVANSEEVRFLRAAGVVACCDALLALNAEPIAPSDSPALAVDRVRLASAEENLRMLGIVSTEPGSARVLEDPPLFANPHPDYPPSRMADELPEHPRHYRLALSMSQGIVLQGQYDTPMQDGAGRFFIGHEWRTMLTTAID